MAKNHGAKMFRVRSFIQCVWPPLMKFCYFDIRHQNLIILPKMNKFYYCRYFSLRYGFDKLQMISFTKAIEGTSTGNLNHS